MKIGRNIIISAILTLGAAAGAIVPAVAAAAPAAVSATHYYGTQPGTHYYG